MVTDEPTGSAGPDYRMLLANERTFLAWQGMSLSLLAASIAIQIVPAPSIPGIWCVLGILLAVLAAVTAGAGLVRWKRANRITTPSALPVTAR